MVIGASPKTWKIERKIDSPYVFPHSSWFSIRNVKMEGEVQVETKWGCKSNMFSLSLLRKACWVLKRAGERGGCGAGGRVGARGETHIEAKGKLHCCCSYSLEVGGHRAPEVRADAICVSPSRGEISSPCNKELINLVVVSCLQYRLGKKMRNASDACARPDSAWPWALPRGLASRVAQALLPFCCALCSRNWHARVLLYWAWHWHPISQHTRSILYASFLIKPLPRTLVL